MASPSSSNAQTNQSVVSLSEQGVNYFFSLDAHHLRIEPSWQWEEGDGINPKILYLIDALDLFDKEGTNKGYISHLNAETKEICYVLNTAPKRMITTTFEHDAGSKVLLDEIALSSFGQ